MTRASAGPLATIARASLVAALALAAHPASAQGQRLPADNPGLELAIDLQDTFANLAARIRPSVATVSAYVPVAARARGKQGGKPASGWQEAGGEAERHPGARRLGTASGFFADRDGNLVTALHALLRKDGEIAGIIDVETHDRRHSLGRVVATEPTLDLAIVQVAVAPGEEPLDYRPIRAAEDEVRVGHWAVVVGDPFGPTTTFAPATVTTVPTRLCYQEEMTATYLQVATRVHPESYGGPVINVRGEVIGIVTRGPVGVAAAAALGPAPYEFVLPINLAKGLLPVLAKMQTYASPWLGISVLEVESLEKRLSPGERAALPENRSGVYIDDLFTPGPAARAGIRVGDFLVAMRGVPLASVYDFQAQLYKAGVGSTVRLDLLRGGTPLAIEVEVEERPANATVR